MGIDRWRVHAQRRWAGALADQRVEPKEELSDVLKAHPDAIVVEDDQVAGIAATKPGSLLSIPELENRVLHVRSFSKSIAPDLRMAAAVAPLYTGTAV